MGNRFKILLLTFLFVLCITSVLLSILSKPASAQETQSEITKEEYILTDFNGYLAIFKNGNDKPIEILEVQLNSLPERDIEKIKIGITAETFGKIITIAEDYE